jgi:hypothetical protein
MNPRKCLVAILPLCFLVSTVTSVQVIGITKKVSAPQTCRVSIPIQEEQRGVKSWYVNADRTIWAHFWTSDPLKSAPGEYKVLWIRPKPAPNLSFEESNRKLARGEVGVKFVVSGRRLDAVAPPANYSVSSVYAQDIRPSSLSFPTQGCWEIRADAGASSLHLTVEVK